MRPLALVLALATLATGAPAPAAEAPRNVVIFVADGLRGAMVDAQLTPELDALRREGVSFPNSHALFPTVTTANASAIATGHYLGDTGNFANGLYVGEAVGIANGDRTATPFLEDDVVLGEMDRQFGGDYLGETTLLAAARARGYSTAALGKVGPTLIQDHTERSGALTIVMDDRTELVNERTRQREGIPISEDLARALEKAGLASSAPASNKPNREQQRYWTDVAGKVVLPMFKARTKPFLLVLWMRDPDYSQHNQLDSRYGTVPGINGETSLAAIRNTDASLGHLRAALRELGLDRTTDLIVTSDHGFSTISKQSDTSHSHLCRYDDVPDGHLPPGFLALDIANALDLPLRDPDAGNVEVDRQPACELPGAGAPAGTMPRHPRLGDGLVGRDPANPDVAVATGAGAGLIYLGPANAAAYAPLLVDFLLRQDYVGGLFLDDELGPIPGTVPLSAIGLVGSARTPRPSIVVSFRSFHTGCAEPLRCAAEVSDTNLEQGQGMHGAFSRADTYNFMAAVGPDFQKRYIDPAPVSNADIAPTVAKLLGLDLGGRGKLVGRVLLEALPGGKTPAFTTRTCLYPAAELGRGPARDEPPRLRLQPALAEQRVGAIRYVGAAGIVGRTLGLDDTGTESCALRDARAFAVLSQSRLGRVAVPP